MLGDTGTSYGALWHKNVVLRVFALSVNMRVRWRVTQACFYAGGTFNRRGGDISTADLRSNFSRM